MTALALVGIAAVGFGVQAQAASYQQVYAFQGGSDGAGPDAPLINVDGTLYGTTAGISSSSSSTIFSLDPTTGAETVLHDFPAAPTYSAGLVEVGRKLYGVHNDTVISLNLDTRQEKVIFNFASPGNSIGDFPSTLIDVGGILYGTTVTGGNSTACTSGGGQPETCGTVFSLDPASGVVATVYSFQGGSDGAHPSAGSFGDQLLNVGHTLYGTIVGSNDDEWTVFSLDLATGAESVVSAFEAPPYSVSNLIDVDGTLYGTVDGTGLHGNGGVFSVNPASGAETVVSVFRQRSHGFNPEGGLTKVRALLYGTTAFGGSNTCRYGCGTIFSLNPGTGVRTVLYEFQGGSDGFYPNSSLLDVGGTLYGVTGAGGSTSCSGGCGTVFALKP